MTEKKEEYHGLPYTYWFPEDLETPPVVVVLAEEREKEASQKLVDLLLQKEFQQKHPCAVLLWEAVSWESWEISREIHDLLFALERGGEIDGGRIYLIGSNGAWSVGSRFPRRFGAVIPLSGWGDPYQARNLKFTPVQAFGALDEKEIPISDTCKRNGRLMASGRRLAMALRTCGSQVSRYRELPGDALSLWENAFAGEAGAETLDWLFAQTRRTQYEVTFVKPGLFRIDDFFVSSSYLVLGTERALLIDTGLGEGDLPGLVHSLTPLPVEVAITHPHRDHISQAKKFGRVYLHERDVKRLPEYEEQMKGFFTGDEPVMPNRGKIIPICDKTQIDLGGGVVVETRELGGHTDNSVIFIDDYHRSVFTGDAIGSGYIVLMICPFAQWRKAIGQFRENLIAFQELLPRLTDYGWYGGHFIQENGCDMARQEYYLSGQSGYFCPISREIAEDMVGLCDRLLDGSISEQELLNTPEHYASYKTAGVNFRFTD